MPEFITLKTLFITSLICQIISCKLLSSNPCIYKWSFQSEPGPCVTPKDCSDPNAECTYSVFTKQRSCCSPVKDAVFPECPNGRTAYSLGKFSKLTCNPLQGDGNDPCPTGYECQKSVTDFTKYPNQPNYVCCKI